MTSSSPCKLLLVPTRLHLMQTRNILMIKWKHLGRQLPLYLTSSLEMSTIYSISIKFPLRKMMLKMMDFKKSPSQHQKPSLTSLTHQVFKNQHSWFRWPISANSCPNPVRLLWQQVLMMLLKISLDNHPVKLQKQHFEVWNITPPKPNTDGQGGQFSTTHAPTMESCFPVKL